MSYLKIWKTDEKYETICDPSITFPFELDKFQKDSITCITKKENIIATAHTGSGKTIIAEYAIQYILKCDKDAIVVYISPTKSLSKEKYSDFREKFSKYDYINIGILTGDDKINPDGNCLIMTAEILRNGLYKLKPNNIKDLDIKNNYVDRIKCLIIDEAHFINDSDRGKVWEEIIVLLNKNVLLVALSATMANADKIAKWIGNIKQKPINLITTNNRIIPLNYYIYFQDIMYLIMDKNNKFITQGYQKFNIEYNKYIKKYQCAPGIGQIQELINHLKKKDMLPVLFFSFSKTNCEKYASMIQTNILDENETKKISKIFNDRMHMYEKDFGTLEQYIKVKQLILKGIAYHHAGLLPILKEIIEIIFHQGLIKILFATETFAVGVNMPTRTVVFTKLQKTTNLNKRFINTAEFKQMSGRAGRRGKDKIGHVIILPIVDFPEEYLLKTLMLNQVAPISSKFKIDYSFYLKAIQSDSTTIDDFMEKSLFYLEYKEESKYFEKELEEENKLINDYSEKFKNLSETEIKDIKDLVSLKSNISNTNFGNVRIKLSKEQIKKSKINNKKFKDKESEIVKNPRLQSAYISYSLYIDSKSHYDSLKNQLEEHNNYIQNIMNSIETYLIKSNYISKLGKEFVILKKGKIAAQINECNSILLTEIIVNDILNDLTSEEIVAILAIFIEESTSDKISFNDIKGTSKIKVAIKKIESLISIFQEKEYELGIYDNQQFWEISYNFINSAYYWVTKQPDYLVYDSKKIYTGSFVKNMIKINNIVEDLIHLFTINGSIEIIPKLSNIKDLIMRDYVKASINSLYL